MKLRAIVHDVLPEDGGGYWAEVPALSGCASQGDTWDELMANIHEAIEGWLQAADETRADTDGYRVVEIAV
jgi:predicted RNase H-like HicB family nuclease